MQSVVHLCSILHDFNFSTHSVLARFLCISRAFCYMGGPDCRYDMRHDSQFQDYVHQLRSFDLDVLLSNLQIAYRATT